MWSNRLFKIAVAVVAVLTVLACASATSPSDGELSSGEQPQQTIMDPTSSAEPTPTTVLSLTPTAPPRPTPKKSHSEMSTESCERFINENREARGEEPIRFRTRKIWDRRDGTLLLAPQEGGFDAPKFVYTISENECDRYEPDGQSFTFTAIGVGALYTCGLKTDGSIACWDNRYATPPADLPPQDIGPNWQIPEGPFASISVGSEHACGVKTDGSVACWGKNGSGEAAPPEGSFTFVSAGPGTSCGVKTDATVVCWGNRYRDFQGKTSTPPEDPFISVDTDGSYACGVMTDGHIACWGNRTPGIWGSAERPKEAERLASLRAGSFVSVNTGGHYACGVKANGSVLCWGDWQYECCGEATAPEDSFSSVSAGGNQTCGVKDDSSVKCWGVLPLQNRDRAEGDCWVKEEHGLWPPQGSVWCWDGSRENPIDSITSIHVIGSYTCGLKSDGSVKCWGISGRLN